MIEHSQNPSPTPNALTQTAINVILVVVETLLTLLLRFDANLRQVAYPLAQDNTGVCIRSYVPNVTIYATFTVNGILLDSELHPNQQVDVTINGFTWQIAQAIFTNKVTTIEQLQLRGELHKVALVKNFLLAVGVGQVVQNLLNASKGDKDEAKAQDIAKPKTTDADYKARIAEQQGVINQLTIEQTEHQTKVLELQSKNKFLTICVAVLAVLMLICLAGWIFF